MPKAPEPTLWVSAPWHEEHKLDPRRVPPPDKYEIAATYIWRGRIFRVLHQVDRMNVSIVVDNDAWKVDWRTADD